MGNHRSRIDIMAAMLSAINEKAKKTQIMYRANLSYELLTKYLDKLSRSYLTTFVQDERRYVLTTKGLEFLDRYKEYLRRNKSVERQISEVNEKRKALEDLCSGN